MATLLARSPALSGGGDASLRASADPLVERLASRSFKRGRFILSSGKTSPIYFNIKTTMMDPEGARLCAEGLLDQLSTLEFDYVSGLEMGAVPLLGAVAALSAQHGKPVPATFVRKTPKAHGTRDMIEGLDKEAGETLAGKRVVIIDDVATSGGSILQAVDEIKAVGGIVEHAIVILDREEGAGDRLAAAGITLHALATATQIGVTAEDRAPA